VPEAEQAERKQRRADAAFPYEEAEDQQDRDADDTDLDARSERLVIDVDEAVDEGREAGRDEHSADHVEALCALVPALRHVAERPPDGEDRDRDVDEEHPAPVEIFGKDAAEDEADGGAAGGDRRPYA